MMRIEKIAGEPDRAGRYFTTLTGGTTLRLYPQVIADLGLYPGCELDEAAYQKLLEMAGSASAKMRAVRIVSASAVSSRDLEQRLVRKGEDPAHAHAAVAWMSELNLVDDGETARQIVRKGIARGYGVARVKQMLYEKQIPRELWPEALADYPEQDEAIQFFLRSRLPAEPTEKDKKRAVDALLRRGHRWEEIRRCLSALDEEMEAYDE